MFSIHIFGSNHYFWKNWGDRPEDRDKFTNNWRDAWFYRPCEHSSGGTGFAFRVLPLRFGVQVSFHWGLS